MSVALSRFLALGLLLLAGCTVVSANRTFPKLAWYWSADAREQRHEKALAQEYRRTHSNTNL